ncbi:hypothetical protein [Exiguobacterium mexicanum]|uniref:hypothetical protein n=1 Tax=Exiguobacterium mexicanum TaxID=340146 RepID=UPI001F0E2D65|nr:hypothetical protein [Exiguobacterium mexicanum]
MAITIGVIILKRGYFYEEVKHFHKTFGHPNATYPKPLTIDRAIKRSVWTAEEAVVEFLFHSAQNKEEFITAIDEFKKGFEKSVSITSELSLPSSEVDRIVGQADALTDALYFVMGSFVELGLDPVPLFEIVQRANMAKLGPDGKPILRASDNKVMKPEGWLPPEPELEAEVRRQLEAKQ